MNPTFLKRLLLLFWAVWFTIVFLSNLTDALKGLEALPKTWTFASGNLKAIQDTTAPSGIPDWANGVLFAGVIVWEGLAALLFWFAALTFRGKGSAGTAVCAAFTISLLLWGSFLVADEVFIAYRFAGTHLNLFIANLATLLAIELLPDAQGQGHHP